MTEFAWIIKELCLEHPPRDSIDDALGKLCRALQGRFDYVSCDGQTIIARASPRAFFFLRNRTHPMTPFDRFELKFLIRGDHCLMRYRLGIKWQLLAYVWLGIASGLLASVNHGIATGMLIGTAFAIFLLILNYAISSIRVPRWILASLK